MGSRPSHHIQPDIKGGKSSPQKIEKSNRHMLAPPKGEEKIGSFWGLIDEKAAEFKEEMLKLKNDKDNDDIVLPCLEDLYKRVTEAWAIHGYGRDLAVSYLDILGEQGGVYILLDFMSNAENVKRQIAAAKLLEQSLSMNNRSRVAKTGLETLVKMSKSFNNSQIEIIGISLLEHMFKFSEETCLHIISFGGLDSILYSCRSENQEVRIRCAKAISNCAIFGGTTAQHKMIEANTHQWLFPLAFDKDSITRYNACIAIIALYTNKELEAKVKESGTLKLVEQFVMATNPIEFSVQDDQQIQGRGVTYLKKLMKFLHSDKYEAQMLAAFHFVMEAHIKKNQDRLFFLVKIGAIRDLMKVAASPRNVIAANLATQALKICDEYSPRILSLDVESWDSDDINVWLKTISFGDLANIFEKLVPTGKELMLLTERHLLEGLKIDNIIARQRFLYELCDFKMNIDYSLCNCHEMASLLTNVNPTFVQYTYNMVQYGITIDTISMVTEDMLLECGVGNSLHRHMLLKSFKDGVSVTVDKALSAAPVAKKNLDVFISYRRSTGSQLASLLRVFLQLRGFSVFIDVEKLEAGQFDNALLDNVASCKTFILILTDGALDKCIGDMEHKDWVHKEIALALTSNCNIVPVMNSFIWPIPEKLPEDMRNICFFNGVKWIHDYQDACIDKIARFIQNPKPPQLPSGQLPPIDGVSPHGGLT